MSVFEYRQNELCAEGISLREIAASVGTPVYCYSAAAIKSNFTAYTDAFASIMPGLKLTICYACKANSNLAIMRYLGSLGAGADIVSEGELLRALAAGITPGKIVYSGVGKTAGELARALDAGILQINVESIAELETLSRIAVAKNTTARIAIRVNPDVDAGTHSKITTGKKENKFGLPIEDAPALYKRAAALPGITIEGVAVHIGSQLIDLSPYRVAYGNVATLVKDLRTAGHNITRLDLGGGIGIRYEEETPPCLKSYAEIVRDTVGNLECEIVLEPGRSLVGNAGLLLTEVISIKENDLKKFMIVDAAMNDLMRPALYDAYHHIQRVRGRDDDEKEDTYDVVGPVCETGDTFANMRSVLPVKDGDLIAIMTSGAYGAVMASNYNTRPLLAEVLVHGEHFDVIRPRQKIEDILAQDSIPSWLHQDC